MSIYGSLRARGVFWIVISLLAGLMLSWLWLSSQARWHDHLIRAYFSGLAVYHSLKDNTSPPPGISITPLTGGQAQLADEGSFTRLDNVPTGTLVTLVSVRASNPAATSGGELSLAILSPDIRYPVAEIGRDGGHSPATAFANITRVVASYCSEPWIYARFASYSWNVIDGSEMWGCKAAPHDLRLPTAIIGVIFLVIMLTQVTETSVHFTKFARALSEREQVDGPELYDATGPKELRETVQAVNTYLEREREQLANRALLLSGISHDLGTPATRLRLRAALIEDGELRSKLENDIDHMSEMINGVLTYTRSELNAEKPQPMSLVSLVESVVADYQDLDQPVAMKPITDKQIELQRSLFASSSSGSKIAVPDAHRIIITGRPLSLHRALSNLIDNSLKYGRRATVMLEANSTHAFISVEDEGSNLTRNQIEKLTAPFVRGKNVGTVYGAGLGLTIVKTIAEQHGGVLEFTDTGSGLRATMNIRRR